MKVTVYPAHGVLSLMELGPIDSLQVRAPERLNNTEIFEHWFTHNDGHWVVSGGLIAIPNQDWTVVVTEVGVYKLLQRFSDCRILVGVEDHNFVIESSCEMEEVFIATSNFFPSPVTNRFWKVLTI